MAVEGDASGVVSGVAVVVGVLGAEGLVEFVDPGVVDFDEDDRVGLFAEDPVDRGLGGDVFEINVGGDQFEGLTFGGGGGGWNDPGGEDGELKDEAKEEQGGDSFLGLADLGVADPEPKEDEGGDAVLQFEVGEEFEGEPPTEAAAADREGGEAENQPGQEAAQSGEERSDHGSEHWGRL